MKTRYKILTIIGIIIISLSGFIALKYYVFPDTSENTAILDTIESENSGVSGIKETILSDASYEKILEKIQYEVDKNNLGQFSALVIKNLKKEYQDGEKITFDLYAFGYRDWCIFPQISLYFDGYDEPIYEKSILHPCPAPTGNPSPRTSHYGEYDFGQFPSCKFGGTYTIKGESYEFDSETLGSFYCNGKKEFHEPKIFDIEIPENAISEKINFEPNEIYLSWGDYIRVTNHESIAILVLGESKQTEKTGEVQFGFFIRPGESWKEKILYEGNHWITTRYENDTIINGMNGTIHFEE